jgi:hypothetical protein
MLQLYATKNRYWTTGYIAGTDEGWVGPLSGQDTLGGSADAFLWQHDTAGNLLRKLRIGEFHSEGFYFVREMYNGYFIVGLVSRKEWLGSNNPFSCYPNKSCYKLFELKEWPVSTSNLNGSLENMELSVYPNPTNNRINISFKKESKEKIEIRVYNQYGSLVQHVTTRTDHTELNTEALHTGIYSVELIYNNQTFHSSFIKQ